MTTQQDYEFTAQAIRAATSDARLYSTLGAAHKVAYVDILAEQFALYFERDDGDFDRQRFLDTALGEP